MSDTDSTTTETPLRHGTQIVTLHSKHYNMQFIVHTQEDLRRAKAQMLRIFVDDQYIVDPGEPYFTKDQKSALALTPEAVEALPEVARTPIERLRASGKSQQDNYLRMQKTYSLAQRLMDAADVEEAISMTVHVGDRKRYMVDYLMDVYGDQEYTRWESESSSSLTDW